MILSFNSVQIDCINWCINVPEHVAQKKSMWMHPFALRRYTFTAAMFMLAHVAEIDDWIGEYLKMQTPRVADYTNKC